MRGRCSSVNEKPFSASPPMRYLAKYRVFIGLLNSRSAASHFRHFLSIHKGYRDLLGRASLTSPMDSEFLAFLLMALNKLGTGPRGNANARVEENYRDA